MKLASGYSKLMDLLFKLIRALLAVALAVMVCITSLEVVRRYIFGLSYVWAEESVKFLLVAVTFLGGAAAFRAGGMAFLDLLTSRLPQGAAKLVSIASNTIIVAMCGYLAYQGFTYTFSPVIAKMVSTGLKLNMAVVYVTIPVGFVLTILFALEKYLELFGLLTRSAPAPQQEGGAD